MFTSLLHQAISENWPTFTIFGLTLASNYDFRSWLPPGNSQPSLAFTCQQPTSLELDRQGGKQIFVSLARLPGIQNRIEIWRFGRNLLIRYAGKADFYVGKDQIVCLPARPDQAQLAALHLLPAVIALWLEINTGFPALHASSIAVREKAVAFMGSKGSGKSTLAAAFAQAGHHFLSDDITVLHLESDRIITAPSIPRLSLMPQQAVLFFTDPKIFQEKHPSTDKRLAHMSESTFGGFTDDKMYPLVKCYLLKNRLHTSSNQIECKLLPPRQALLMLMRHAYSPRMGKSLGLWASRLAFFARLIELIEVCELNYPNGCEVFPDLVDHVQNDLTNIR